MMDVETNFASSASQTGIARFPLSVAHMASHLALQECSLHPTMLLEIGAALRLLCISPQLL